MIKVAVFDSNLTVVSKNQLNTGSENYYQVAFVFNETWDNFSKYAVFYQVANQPKIEVELIPDSGLYYCNLPNEMLIANLPVYVGAYGITDNIPHQIISTNFAALPVRQGAFSDNLISAITNNSSLVRSVDTQIRYIRENNGDFEYSTNGTTWNTVHSGADYSALWQKINELEQTILPLQQSITTIQNILATGYGKTQTGNTISDNETLEGRYVFNFFKADWVKENNNSYYLSLYKNYFRLDNAYVSSFILSVVIKNNETIIDQETTATFCDKKQNNGDIRIYISLNLAEYQTFTGKIILKGDKY